ncbi:MAG: hypothetical protein V3U84_06220 [Thiotrichaceae bacterium]
MYKQVLLIITGTLLAGCVSIPKTPDALVSTPKLSASYCYANDVSPVQLRIKHYLNGCYKTVETDTMLIVGGAFVFLPMTLEFYVVEEMIPGGKRYSVGNRHGYGFSAEVVDGADGCRTHVGLYAVTGFWQKTFIQTDRAAKGMDAHCTK